MTWMKTAFAALFILLLPAQVMSAGFDGSAPLLCAVVDVLECSTEGICERGSAESVNIPQFVKIDFKGKRITEAVETEQKKSTAIKNLEHMDGKLIMQGAENGRAWSIIISEETGKMSVAVTEDRFGFVIFGACTPQ